MKVCISTSEYLPTGSGIAIACSEFVYGLEENGVQVDVLSSSSGADIIIKPSINLPGILGLLSFWDSAFKYLLDNQDTYDLIWLHQPLFIGRNSARKIRRAVVSIHTTYYGFKVALNRRSSPILRIYYAIASKFESYVFKSLNQLSEGVQIYAITPTIATEAKMNGLKKNISILPNCINPNKFKIQKKSDARRKLVKFLGNKISNDSNIFLSVGRLDEVKRPENIIKIFQLYNTLDPSSHLLLVGGGYLYRTLEKLASHNNNIHVLGKIDRKLLSTFYSGADVFISMSRYEGLPMTLLEATHYSLPLILSDIPAHRWLSKMVHQPCRIISINELDLSELKIFIDNHTSLDKPRSCSSLPKYFQTNFVVDNLFSRALMT